MNWTEEMQGWAGRFIEIRIEDQAGDDPIAQPRIEMLAKLRMSDDGDVLEWYFNDRQFLAVPVYNDGRTVREGKLFRSADEGNKLVYRIALI
ncbi:hypothetical protein DNH61_13740 [Paenibacillus sambharensis]|uniref:Uncharacterized protein n=1 Tax=Paenibacillus sambharensis TaxID=1803190 RepID=A0A2W1LM74_9BACL|nr:hypothetical protein [Paenibacillus sambharensis]PZD95584.1 hypothetical protein DNH61_13740 [Paenibacillus sambharensis]